MDLSTRFNFTKNKGIFSVYKPKETSKERKEIQELWHGKSFSIFLLVNILLYFLNGSMKLMRVTSGNEA